MGGMKEGMMGDGKNMKGNDSAGGNRLKNLLLSVVNVNADPCCPSPLIPSRIAAI